MITISSYSGGGKTAIAAALAHSHDVLLIQFDEIDSLMAWHGDYGKWLAQGADYEEFDLRRMKDYVTEQALREKPRGIVFDYPFGRLHSAFKSKIDLAVFIDTPLDVAMARRLLRDMPQEGHTIREWLENELQGYLTLARRAYLEMARQVKPTCDLVIDGTQTIDAIRQEIEREAAKRGLLNA